MGLLCGTADANGITFPIAQLPQVWVDCQTAKADFTFIAEGFIDGSLTSSRNHYLFDIPGFAYLRLQTLDNVLLSSITRSDGSVQTRSFNVGVDLDDMEDVAHRVLIMFSYDSSTDKVTLRCKFSGEETVVEEFASAIGGTAFGNSVGSSFMLPGKISAGSGNRGWDGILSLGVLMNTAEGAEIFEAIWDERPFEGLRALYNEGVLHDDIDAVFYMGEPAGLTSGISGSDIVHYYARGINEDTLLASTFDPTTVANVNTCVPFPDPTNVGGMDLSAWLTEMEAIDVGGSADSETIPAYLPIWRSVLDNTFTGRVGIFGIANSRGARNVVSQPPLNQENTPYSGWATGFQAQLRSLIQSSGSTPQDPSTYLNTYEIPGAFEGDGRFNVGMYSFFIGTSVATGSGPAQLEYETVSGTVLTSLADNSIQRFGTGSTSNDYGPGRGAAMVNTARHRVVANMLTGSAFTRSFHLIRGIFGVPGGGSVTVKRQKEVFGSSTVVDVVSEEVVNLDTTVATATWDSETDSIDSGNKKFIFGANPSRNPSIVANVRPGMLVQNGNQYGYDEVVSVLTVGDTVEVTMRFGDSSVFTGGSLVTGRHVKFGPLKMFLHEFSGSWSDYGSDSFVFWIEYELNGDGNAGGSTRIPLAGAGMFTFAAGRPNDRQIWCIQSGWGGRSYDTQLSIGWTDHLRVIAEAFGQSVVIAFDATQNVTATNEGHQQNWETLIDAFDSDVDIILTDDICHDVQGGDILREGGGYTVLQEGAKLAAENKKVGYVPIRNDVGDFFRHYALQGRQDGSHIYNSLTYLAAYHVMDGSEFLDFDPTQGGHGNSHKATAVRGIPRLRMSVDMLRDLYPDEMDEDES